MCVRWSALLALLLALGIGRDAVAAPATSAVPQVIAKTDGAKSSKSKRATKSTSKSKRTRQFTGVVTALDKASMTVEKGGKKARSMVFVREDATKTEGDLAKNVRATVYYREHDGKFVAHRVVVKPEPDDED